MEETNDSKCKVPYKPLQEEAEFDSMLEKLNSVRNM
jgi:hypothetical protein